MGIVNGTTNFILTKMTAEKAEFADALAEAQRLGYAEPNPTNDVEGFDASFKLAILASIAFESRVRVESIYREGITSPHRPRTWSTPANSATSSSCSPSAPRSTAGSRCACIPCCSPPPIPSPASAAPSTPSSCSGSSVGEVMFYGQGAGALPTGSALVGDIIDVARNIRFQATGRVSCTCFDEKPALPIEELRTRFYLRTDVADRPGVLAAIATIFGEEGVSLASVLQMWRVRRERGDRLAHSPHQASARCRVHSTASPLCPMSTRSTAASVWRVQRGATGIGNK